VGLGAIADLPFISSPHNQVRREIEEDALRAYGIVRTRIHLEFGHPEAIKQAVRSGAGVAFVMESSVSDELARGLLTQLKTPDLNLPVPVFLVHRRGKTFSNWQAQLIVLMRQTGEARTQRSNGPAAIVS